MVNPYDPCVANKTYKDGSQCTICWYVDDLKISHCDPNVVTKVIESIEERFGKMKVTRGKDHVYLGMKIKFGINKDVQIRMSDYIQEAIDDFTQTCKKNPTSPAGEHIFQVRDDVSTLCEKDRKLFHSIVAKLLYISRRGRPDIQVPVAFLTTRVTKADDDDWKKLHRVLCYLKNTIDLPLVISIDNLNDIRTWVDASFAVHPNMRSDTGGYISMGKGTLYASSKKQKINTKSSTEAELVGASDFLPQALWTRHFLEAQGYDISQNLFYQDNQSAMKLEKNGRQSSSQRTRHVNIRYFFIKDKIDQGEITLEYCPTDRMIADFFTKPLQGSSFRRLRDVVMGAKHYSTLEHSKEDIQERVGDDGFENNDSGDIDKENLKSKLSLNNSLNHSQMRIKLNRGRIYQVKGIDRIQNTSDEPVTPVTKNGYPPSRMTYVDVVRKGTSILK